MTDSTEQGDLQSQIEQLRSLLNYAMNRIGQLENPQGRLFLADTSNPGSTFRAMVEMIPNVAGDALANLSNGRAVSGATDPGVFLAIDALGSGQRAFLGFANGTNKVYVPVSEQLRYGVITNIGPCNSYCTVKESDSDGILLSDILVTVAPAPGGCSDSANGFCYTVGDVIAYMADPKDTTFGVQVGAYKTVSVRYICTTTSTANVPDLSEAAFYNGDFTLIAAKACGDDGPENEADIYWNGNFIRQYTGNGSNFDHVKVFDFGNVSNASATGTINVDYSELAIHITSGTTNANVPTVGGSPCADASGPNFAKFSIRAKIGTAVTSIDSVVCNEDETITVNYSTGRVLVPIT